jgi:hypothetical protein
MNILQNIFKDNYEIIEYSLHPRHVVMENIAKMINCGDPAFGGAMYGCPHCGLGPWYPNRPFLPGIKVILVLFAVNAPSSNISIVGSKSATQCKIGFSKGASISSIIKSSCFVPSGGVVHRSSGEIFCPRPRLSSIKCPQKTGQKSAFFDPFSAHFLLQNHNIL